MKMIRTFVETVSSVLWWSVGENRESLAGSTGRAKTKAAALGACVWIVAIMATISATIFLQHTFGLGFFAAAPFASLFGTIVFVLDRSIIIYFRSDAVLSTILRVALSAALSLTVAHPLLLSFFDKKIESELNNYSIGQSAIIRQREAERFNDEVARLNDLNREMKTELAALATRRNEAEKLLLDEIDGHALSNKRGEGPIALRKRESFDAATKEYNNRKEKFEPLIAANDQRLVEIQKEINGAANLGRDAAINETDSLGKTEALIRVLRKQPVGIIWVAALFVIFMTIDLLPISLKIAEASDRGRLLKAQRRMLNRMFKMIDGKHTTGLHPDEENATELLRRAIIKRTIRECLKDSAQNTPFGSAMRLEFVGFPEFHFEISLPTGKAATGLLEDISVDIDSSIETIKQHTGRSLRREKVTNSVGETIDPDIPILEQLGEAMTIVVELNDVPPAFFEDLHNAPPA